MKKKIIYILIALVSLVSLLCLIQKPKDNHEGKVRVEMKTFPIIKGYGYDILIDGKVHIHQDRIPGVPGKIPFQTEEEASKVGDLVISKLVEGKRPSVSEIELKELGITF